MTTSLASPPQLLALDWGTSSLRAFLMRERTVLETRQSERGIQHLPLSGVSGFEQALAELAGDWVGQWPHLPIVACGMVGSAQGWREAPYVRCPADIRTLAGRGVLVPSGLGPDILIAPGILFDEPGVLPDVMRGEEIQIAGAFFSHPGWGIRSRMLLPGTHSKWATIEDGKIVRYATYLTGELFAVLCQHSILGRLMPAHVSGKDAPDWGAMELGLETARSSAPGDLSHQIFGARTLGLTGRLPAESLGDYLSGLLIGHELVSGMGRSGADESLPEPLVLIGAPLLCRRYAHCLSYLGKTVDCVLENTAPIGLWHFAAAAGLV